METLEFNHDRPSVAAVSADDAQHIVTANLPVQVVNRFCAHPHLATVVPSVAMAVSNDVAPIMPYR